MAVISSYLKEAKQRLLQAAKLLKQAAPDMAETGNTMGATYLKQTATAIEAIANDDKGLGRFADLFAEYKVGDFVTAGGRPGKITKISGKDIYVTWADGDTRWYPNSSPEVKKMADDTEKCSEGRVIQSFAEQSARDAVAQKYERAGRQVSRSEAAGQFIVHVEPELEKCAAGESELATMWSHLDADDIDTMGLGDMAAVDLTSGKIKPWHQQDDRTKRAFREAYEDHLIPGQR